MTEKKSFSIRSNVRVLVLTFFLTLVLTGSFFKSPASAASAAANTAKSGATVTVRQVNSWQSDGHWYYQYDMTLTNGKSRALNGWAFTLAAPGATASDSFWNCNLKINGSSLTFVSLSYNKKAAKNAQVKNVGFILRFDQETTTFTGTYKYNGKAKCFVRVSASDKEPVVSAKSKKTEKPKAAKKKTTKKTSKKATKKTTKKATKKTTKKASKKTTNKKTAAKKSNAPAAEKVPSASAGSAYSSHGRLSVSGTELVDNSGNTFQLKGVSTHGLAWFPKYVNESAFKTLRDSWGVNTVRLAMYTQEYGGYCSGGRKSDLESVIDKGVKAASKLGMYVIIDWHILSDGNPNTHKREAIDFFSRMSAKYRNYGNVIYEICNEPNGGTSWDQIRAYANEIIPVIRQNTNAVILVGTPTWSQDVDQVIGRSVDRSANVMYSLHFYAGTHKDGLRSKLTKARNAGIAIFISEFSICDASGNGAIDYNSAAAWKKLINDNKISYCGWSLCNKNETSALIKSSVSKSGDWNWDDLSEAGRWLMTMTCGE